MKSICTAFLIFLILLFFSCTQHQINNDKKIITPQVFGIVMDADTIKPPKIIIAGLPKTIIIPRNNKLLKPQLTVSPNAHFTNFNTEQGLALSSIGCGYYDKTGNLWLGTYGGGVSKYDGKSFINFTTAQGLANNNVVSITEDKTGNLWFGTYGGGVSKYDGKSFTNFTTALGLANNTVLNITEDKIGNLWFGTYGGGVSKYDGNRVDAIERGDTIAQRTQQDLKRINGKLVKSFTNFTTAQGLTNNTVRSIIEDKTGNLWFGTFGGGVSKYDGNRVEAIERGDTIAQRTQQDLEKINGKLVKTFTNFTTADGLANNTVFSIIEDKVGNLWFGTDGGGVSKYDGNRVESIERGDTIAQRTQQDLKKINGKLVKSFTNFTTADGLANNTVFSITEDKTGNFWFGTDGGGVSKYDGKSFTNFTTAQGLANNTVWSITEDKTGNLWFGTDGGGVSKYEGISFTNFTTDQGLANNTVFSITEDKTGNLWFGTDGGGVSKYDGNRVEAIARGDKMAQRTQQDLKKINGKLVKSFINFTTAQGLANNTILNITEDKTGNLWFGTQGGGISKYDGNRVDAIERGDTIAQQTQQDLKKINGKLVKSFTNFTTAQGLTNNNVRCIFEDKIGNLWFGTYGGGVSKYDGNRVEAIERGDTIAQRTQQNLKKINGKLVKSYTNFTTAQGLANNNVRSITEDKDGNLWFGTQGGGVSKYDGKTFTNFTTAQGLANNNVFSITEDKTGNLWFGTQNGLCYFVVGGAILSTTKFQEKNKKSNKERVGLEIKNYTIANGLPDNFITQVLQLPNGKIAVGTNAGITVFNPGLPLDANNKLSGLEIFNGSTGYPIKDVNVGQNCMYLDRKGIIWAGTGEGKISLVRFDYNAVNHKLNAPTVVIQNVKLNEQNICYYTLDSKTDTAALPQQEMLTYNRTLTAQERDSIKKQFKGIKFDGITSFYPLPQNLILPYKHNNITIEYNCVEVSNHFMVNYQYMLEGYDNDWSPVLKKQEATYGNINEGTYTFKLKAQSPDGIWCEPTTYTFTVLPPWWRTWWMYTVYGILVITLIVLIIWWNGRKLKARAIELTEQVKKATITIIKQKEIVEEQKKVVEKKHKEITDSINYAERIQRALLASKKLLDENLTSTGPANRDYFILFKPKDVVSGDFYWATKLSNNNFVLVNADSTGHGVPGAIMSIVNIACLDKAVTQGITSPELLLNETRRLVIENLKNDGSAEGGKDGMDGSLLSFDFKNNILHCASANNPVWIIRGNELIEIKADRLPIGKHDRDNIPFTLHTLNLQKGDVVYTLTDGFPDQFGGANGKKFKHKPLQNLLLAMANEPMETQKQKLNDVFDKWKGNMEQVDDVCLIGIRV